MNTTQTAEEQAVQFEPFQRKYREQQYIRRLSVETSAVDSFEPVPLALIIISPYSHNWKNPIVRPAGEPAAPLLKKRKSLDFYQPVQFSAHPAKAIEQFKFESRFFQRTAFVHQMVTKGSLAEVYSREEYDELSGIWTGFTDHISEILKNHHVPSYIQWVPSPDKRAEFDYDRVAYQLNGIERMKKEHPAVKPYVFGTMKETLHKIDKVIGIVE